MDEKPESIEPQVTPITHPMAHAYIRQIRETWQGASVDDLLERNRVDKIIDDYEKWHHDTHVHGKWGIFNTVKGWWLTWQLNCAFSKHGKNLKF